MPDRGPVRAGLEVRDGVTGITLPGMRCRHVPLCALVVALLVAGCGSGDRVQTAAPAAAEQQLAASLAADLRPLQVEALALFDLVLAAGPDASTAALVARVVDEQQALLADVDALLADASAGAAGTGALTEGELQAVRDAAGNDAVRLGVDGLFRNHLAAVSRAKAELVEGRRGAVRELADRVLATEGATLQELTATG